MSALRPMTILAWMAFSSLPASLNAQETPASGAADVALPSASIQTEEELSARLKAPAPSVNAANSKLDMEGGILPEFLAAIAAEREALEQRAAALDQREAEIAFASAALSTQERQLSALKGEIERLLGVADESHLADVARLVKIYRAMKPVEAAQILSNADLEVTVLVLAAMSERDAGPIVAKMDQLRAQAVSKIILERSRLPGDQRLINVKVN